MFKNFSLRFAVPVHWKNYLAPTSISGIGLPLFYLPGVTLLTKAGVAAFAWKAILVERASMAVPVGLGTKETAV